MVPEKFAAKLQNEKDTHEFGELRHTVNEPSTRSINTFIPPVAPRLLQVLNILMALPDRRHAILVDSDNVAAVLAHALPNRKILYVVHMTPKWNLPPNVTHMDSGEGVRLFNDSDEYDTIIMFRTSSTTGYRIRDGQAVLSSTCDLSRREAVQFANRARANMDADEDIRTMIFVNRPDTETYMRDAAENSDEAFGFS